MSGPQLFREWKRRINRIFATKPVTLIVSQGHRVVAMSVRLYGETGGPADNDATFGMLRGLH